MQGAEEAIKAMKDELAESGDLESADALDEASDNEELEDEIDDALDEKNDSDLAEKEEEDADDVDASDEEDDEDETADETDEAEKAGDVKKLRKNIERNFKKKLKEKDGEIAAMAEALKAVQLKQAEQDGFIKATSQPKVEEHKDVEPDFDLDPEEHMQWKLRKLEQENQELRSGQETTNEYVREQKDRRAISGLQKEYLSRNPNVDFDSAKQFLKDRERAVLRLQFPAVTDAEVDKYFDNYEMQMYKTMAKENKNAADVIVAMAKEHGYEAAPASGGKPRPNLKKIKENQRRNTSVIGGTNAVKEHTTTPEQVFSMSMEDLLKSGKDIFSKAHKNVNY